MASERGDAMANPADRKARCRASALICAALAAGCAGEGELRVAISGERAAVAGWPVVDGETAIGFADGWSLRFDVLVVSIEGFVLRTARGAEAELEADPVLVDLTDGDVVGWTFGRVPAERWDDVRFTLAPPPPDARVIGEVDPALVARMRERGSALHLTATATRGALTRRLVWDVPLHVLNSRCQAADGTDGVVIRAGATTETELTMHLDHLFFDSLALEDASMRMDAIAAAADAAGVVTFDALALQRLADLRGLDGSPLVGPDGDPVVYDPGSAALPEPTLRAMIEAAARTIGHLEGEGHCEYTPL